MKNPNMHGGHPPRSPEAQAEYDAKVTKNCTVLGSGLTVSQVFNEIELALDKQRKTMGSIGFYILWHRFLVIAREPIHPLLATKLSNGYQGYMIDNDAELVEEEPRGGASITELGIRFRQVRESFEKFRLGVAPQKVERYARMTEPQKAADAYAAKIIFDWGYQAGLAEAKGSSFERNHRQSSNNCLCEECADLSAAELGKLAQN